MTRSKIATILNVEDYAISRDATSEILRRAGYNVVDASTGAEALKLVDEVQPHLILLDIRLPDMSGYDVCKKLKSQSSTRLIPVLHISGSFVNEFDKVRGLEGGADGYLVKPVKSAELIATINAFLRIRDAEVSVRESEERLRIALDAAQMGAWEFIVSTAEISMDSRARELLGEGESATALLGNVHPEDRTEVETLIESAIRSKGHASLEFRMKANGDYRWLEADAQVKTDYGDQVMRLAGVVRDISDRKVIEDERAELLRSERDARGDAEAANRARDEFLAIVAHALRSPLNAVLGWAQILQRGKYTPETLKHAIDIIENSARSQQKLIEDLLDSARIVSGKLRLEIHPVDVIPVVEAALETVRAAANLKRISLTTAYGNGIDRVRGDVERLQQIVWNLLSNAIKFTPEGGSVRVRVERTETTIRLSVEDTGAGIKPDFLPFIFDRFLQADGATAKRHSGLGLGLALVWHLVDLHRGSVRAESAGEGLGSTFIVNLPLGDPTSARTPTSDNGAAASGLTLPAALDSLRILVVDDDADSRELVRIILEQHGANVVATGSALEALAVLDDKTYQKPDCLVSDIGMPDHSGYWLIGKLRERSREEGGAMPAIALTAFGRASDRIAALTAGFQRHISKPLDPSELVMVIASLASRQRITQKREA